jgi:hypothetical protein
MYQVVAAGAHGHQHQSYKSYCAYNCDDAVELAPDGFAEIAAQSHESVAVYNYVYKQQDSKC